MEKPKIFFANGLLKVLKWIFFAVVFAFMVLVIGRVIYMFRLDKVNAQVAKIHATKLELKDVMGENLPPDPGEKADDTLAGYDVNQNGIRDDVELAIFREYPDSPHIRAPLLQYAMALQMEFTQPVINTIIVDKVVGEQSRADSCVANSLVPRERPESERSSLDMEKIDKFISFVEILQINNDARREAQKDFYENLGNFANSQKKEECDLDIS